MVERRPVLDWAKDWDHLGRQYHEQAIEVWSDLRERSPIAHTDRFGRAWMPVRFEDIAAVAHDTTRFSSLEVNLFDVKPERMLTLPPIMLDPPDHAAHRRLMLPRFTPTAVAELIPVTEALCHRLLDRIADAGRADAGIDYAQHVPVLITAKLLGLPDADADQFRAWIHDIIELGFTDPEANQRASREVLAYFNDHLEDRRERGGDDLTAWLAHAHLGDSPLPPRTQAAMLFLLLIGGIDTTWTTLGAALYHFATHPEDQARLRAEPELLDSAIEEVLRFYAPVEIGRIVTQNTELAGRSVSAGDHVWLSYPAANRDPEAFDEADRFIIDREHNRHLAFGVGVHRCLGSNLARMELQVAVRTWFERIPTFELDPTRPVGFTQGGTVRGPRVIPLRF